MLAAACGQGDERIETGAHAVVEYLLARRPELGELDADFDLIDGRVLDSLGFMDFVFFIEETTGARISLEDVVPEDFRTVRAITARFFDGRSH